MPDERRIYREQADRYERLISREDYQHNIIRSLRKIASLDGADIIDLGAGTGRLTCMLAPLAKRIRAFDLSPHMLDVAAAKLKESGLDNWQVQVADHRNVPAGDRWADVVISGWSVGYLIKGEPDAWMPELRKALAEMKRIVRPGGTIVLLETQGTGFETPHPPEQLLSYFDFLEDKGFSSTWIRTDYSFESLQEAESLVRFFFGDELARQVRDEQWIILPECTGIWWIKAAEDAS